MAANRSKRRTLAVLAIASCGGLSIMGFSSLANANVPTPPPPVTGSDFSTMRARLLAEYPTAKIPETAVVRAVSLQDHPAVQAACLDAKGFDSSVSDDQAVVTKVESGKDEAFQVARIECATEYPLQEKYTRPLTPSQLATLYKYQTEDLTQCLVHHGVTVPKAPTLSTFQSHYGSASTWTPYSHVQTSGARWSQINAECPQYPSNIFDQ